MRAWPAISGAAASPAADPPAADPAGPGLPPRWAVTRARLRADRTPSAPSPGWPGRSRIRSGPARGGGARTRTHVHLAPPGLGLSHAGLGRRRTTAASAPEIPGPEITAHRAPIGGPSAQPPRSRTTRTQAGRNPETEARAWRVGDTELERL